MSFLPFEIHITVSTTVESIEHFIDVCKKLQVKPIIIDVNTSSFDVMTSSNIVTDNSGVYNELNRIKQGLIKYGFNVIREKIETVPWHPAAPTIDNAMPENCYFECHFKILTDNDNVYKIKEISNSYNCHMSKNIFKKLSNDKFFQMLTVRSHTDSVINFKDRVDTITSSLMSKNLLIENVIVEFAIYDSNVSHDTQWLNL